MLPAQTILNLFLSTDVLSYKLVDFSRSFWRDRCFVFLRMLLRLLVIARDKRNLALVVWTSNRGVILMSGLLESNGCLL